MLLTNYLDVLKKYVAFEGRAGRPEFWWYVLANVIVSFVLGIIDLAIGSEILGGLYALAVLLPGLSVLSRRLHDTDRTAWWMLLYFIPFLGWIVLIVFAALEGTPGPNKYGQGPAPLGSGPSDNPYGV